VWLRQRLREREHLYTDEAEAGLFSVLTPVWDGSPVPYLRKLADSLAKQNAEGACEWIVLDNGCYKPALRRYLNRLSQFHWVKVGRLEENVGIVRGLRFCLERANGRYVLPVDADDYLFRDTLRVAASFLRRENYPPLVYTDEDKVSGERFQQPYFKPDWDPVLFVTSAYIAHLNIVDRKTALAVGAYTDAETEGSPDWDLFVRFVLAGHVPVHLPEVLYSWRIHARSTADDSKNKSFVQMSQKAVLRRFLAGQAIREKFEIRESPFSVDGSDWQLYRRHSDARKIISILLSRQRGKTRPAQMPALRDYPESVAFELAISSELRQLATWVREIATEDDLIHFQGQDVQAEGTDWTWEALGLFELHPDTVMVGGRIRTRKGTILSAGQYFGFNGVCGSPHRGKRFRDSGYFANMWKQRSVSAVSTQFSVIQAKFLAELLKNVPAGAALAFLGAWAGARAMRTGRRVIYTPFLSGVSELDWDLLVSSDEKELFAERNADLIPDRRYYSRHLSLEKGFFLAKHEKQPLKRAVGA
jgi:glycosyltransferase involved in cell wall biosynthesis